ncbi:putative protein family UPF0183 [Niveomyces insectorum RCEF 264]|uniref:Uncharacterized protein n=1 Tax=Niveomyces insectorum RCEF 264 TaxID=1081102 RepID=A0A167N9Q9_9HYPO|nr:putative protein family UPF0183 [Niveomyces insectorum RCEF 264]
MSSTLFTAQLHPGRALGFLVLGASLHDVLTRLKAEPQRFPKLDLAYSPKAPVHDPVIVTLPANGLRLRFDGPEQRLRLIEVLDFTKNHIFFKEQNKDRDLVKRGDGSGSGSGSGGPTFRHIYGRFLGPTYDGEFIAGGGDAATGMGTYVLSYPGVAFTFPMAVAAYTPGKDVVALLSTPGQPPADSMAVFSGDSWAQARAGLWTEALPPVKSFAPLAKGAGKDVPPDEVALVRLHGGGTVQLMRRRSAAGAAGAVLTGANPQAASSSSAATQPTTASSAPSSASFWLALGETTPQELVAELGPPDAIYRKSDQRMYIHKIRTASNSRARPSDFFGGGGGSGSGGGGMDALHNHHRDDLLTDTDQSSLPTASEAEEDDGGGDDDDDDNDEDAAIEDELLTGNVSKECFFNYFYQGFDVLVSTPTAPSPPPPPPPFSSQGQENGDGDCVPERVPLRTGAPDRLVATKIVLHGNVPGSYPFNRHRRCRWELAYPVGTVGDGPAATTTAAAAAAPETINAETAFPQIEAYLQRVWWPTQYASSGAAADAAPRPRQRGMVLNRGWGDSPGSSIELLGGWEEGQREMGSGGNGGGGGGGGGGGDGTLRNGQGAEDATTTLYGFPGLVFEVLRNGFVSAVTVF